MPRRTAFWGTLMMERKGSLGPPWTWAKATLGGRCPSLHDPGEGTSSSVPASTCLSLTGDSTLESTG